MAVKRMAWVVLILALGSAVASSFGPPVQRWGIDLGSLGTAVFGVMLWVGVWFFTREPDRIFPPDWSLAERRGWSALVFVVLISLEYVNFMVGLGALAPVPATLGELPAQRFTASLVVLFIAWGVVSSAIGGKEEPLLEADERDLRLRRAADHVGDWALTVAILWCVGLLVGQPEERLAWWLKPLIAANVLIGILIGKTLVEHVYLVSRYAWDRR